MDNDIQKSTSRDGQPEQEHLDRRQFFNGLGKWSLAVIAAATALRDGLDDIQSGSISAFETTSGSGGHRPQLIARKKRKRRKGPHTDVAFEKHAQHIDNVSKKKLPGGKIRTPGGSPDRAE